MVDLFKHSKNEIFTFFDQITDSKKNPLNAHPEDKSILDVVDKKNLLVDRRLPIPWSGPLLNAKVYILLANPGHEHRDFKRDEGKDYQSYWRKMIRDGTSEMLGFGNDTE